MSKTEQKLKKMAKYPVFLQLFGKKVLVVGAGKVAARKIVSLLDCGAKVRIVAKDIDKKTAKLREKHSVEVIESEYISEHLDGAKLVIAATSDEQLNKQIYEDCRRADILCNVVDVPELCDFYVPAVIKRGDLQIAISTNGSCPAFSAHMRKKLEEIITDDYEDFLGELKEFRQKVLKQVQESERRKAILAKMTDDESFEYFKRKGPVAWRNRAEKFINQED